jgi:ABC-2 type transport system permease protein
VSLDAYIQYWRINLLTMLEYRANFIMWFGFSIIYHATAVLALWVTLHQFPSLNGWDFKESAFMYGLWMLGHSLNNTVFASVRNVPEFVREGRFDRFLVRPLDTFFQTITVPQQIFPDELILAIVYFCVVTAYSQVHVDAIFVLYVPLVALGGALIDAGIALAIAAASFWFVKIDALTWVMMSLEQDFSRYPISIYSRGVRVVMAFIFPFAFMNYFPATYLLHKVESGLQLNPAVGLLTPIVGAVWLGAAYLLWRVGLNKYQGTGS